MRNAKITKIRERHLLFLSPLPSFLFFGIVFPLLFGFVGLGCRTDDGTNDISQSNSTDMTDESGQARIDIIGEWRLVSVEPIAIGVGDLPQQTLTIKSDGTWISVTHTELPGFGELIVTAKGTYNLTANRVMGETTVIETIPPFALPIPSQSGIPDESTIDREGDALIIISRDEISGQTTITVYEKTTVLN